MRRQHSADHTDRLVDLAEVQSGIRSRGAGRFNARWEKERELIAQIRETREKLCAGVKAPQKAASSNAATTPSGKVNRLFSRQNLRSAQGRRRGETGAADV